MKRPGRVIHGRGASVLDSGLGKLKLGLVIHQASEGFQEIPEGSCRQHDGVAATADIFSDLHKATTLIFLQVEEEYLPIHGHFLGCDWLRRHLLLASLLIGRLLSLLVMMSHISRFPLPHPRGPGLALEGLKP